MRFILKIVLVSIFFSLFGSTCLLSKDKALFKPPRLLTTNFTHPKLKKYETLLNEKNTLSGIAGRDHTGLIFDQSERDLVIAAANDLANDHGVVVFEYNRYGYGPNWEEFYQIVDGDIRENISTEFVEEVNHVIISVTDDYLGIKLKLKGFEQAGLMERVEEILAEKPKISDSPWSLLQKMEQQIIVLNEALDACSYKITELKKFLTETPTQKQDNQAFDKDIFSDCSNGSTSGFMYNQWNETEDINSFKVLITTLESGDINLSTLYCDFKRQSVNSAFILYFKGKDGETLLEFTALKLADALSFVAFLGYDVPQIKECLYPKLIADLEAFKNNCNNLDVILTSLSEDYLEKEIKDELKYTFLETILACRVDIWVVNEKEIVLKLLKSINDYKALYTYFEDDQAKIIKIYRQLKPVGIIGSAVDGWTYAADFSKIISALYFAYDENNTTNNFVYFGTFEDEDNPVLDGAKYVVNTDIIANKLSMKYELWDIGLISMQHTTGIPFEANPLNPVKIFIHPDVATTEEGMILPAISVAVKGWMEQDGHELKGLLDGLNFLGVTVAARILTVQGAGFFLKAVALIEIGNFAITEALKNQEVKTALINSGDEGKWFVEKWPYISIALDIATISGSLLTELGEKGPAVSRQLRAQGETDAADRLDEIVVHLNGIGGGRIFVKDLVDFTIIKTITLWDSRLREMFEIPKYNNFALGKNNGGSLKEFGDEIGANVWTNETSREFAEKYRIPDYYSFERSIESVLNETVNSNGGKILFDLNGVNIPKGIEGGLVHNPALVTRGFITELELQMVLRKKLWFDNTIFHNSGIVKTSEELSSLGIKLIE